MRVNGFFWVRIIEHGSQLILLYRDGAWIVDIAIDEQDLVVLEGPLVPPTPEEVAGQEAHFANRLIAEWKEQGYDPRWGGQWLQGFYWVQRIGATHPEIAEFMEGNWGGLDWGDNDWFISEGELGPEVLFGPLDLALQLPISFQM